MRGMEVLQNIFSETGLLLRHGSHLDANNSAPLKGFCGEPAALAR